MKIKKADFVDYVKAISQPDSPKDIEDNLSHTYETILKITEDMDLSNSISNFKKQLRKIETLSKEEHIAEKELNIMPKERLNNKIKRSL